MLRWTDAASPGGRETRPAVSDERRSLRKYGKRCARTVRLCLPALTWLHETHKSPSIAASVSSRARRPRQRVPSSCPGARRRRAPRRRSAPQHPRERELRARARRRGDGRRRSTASKTLVVKRPITHPMVSETAREPGGAAPAILVSTLARGDQTTCDPSRSQSGITARLRAPEEWSTAAGWRRSARRRQRLPPRLPGRPHAEAEVPHLPGGRPRQRRSSPEWCPCRGGTVEVDVGAEAPQRGVELLRHLRPREAAVAVTHREVELRREHVRVARPRREQLAEELLGRAAPVDVRGVDEVDPELEGAIDTGCRSLAQDAAAVGQPGAEADLGDGECARAEPAVLHAVGSRTPPSPRRTGPQQD